VKRAGPAVVTPHRGGSGNGAILPDVSPGQVPAHMEPGLLDPLHKTTVKDSRD